MTRLDQGNPESDSNSILLLRWLHLLMARRHWLLDSGPSGAWFLGSMTPLEMIPIVGRGFCPDGRVVPRFGLWRNIPRRHGLVDFGSPSGSFLEGRGFPLKGMCSRGGTGTWLLAPLVIARLTKRMRNA